MEALGTGPDRGDPKHEVVRAFELKMKVLVNITLLVSVGPRDYKGILLIRIPTPTLNRKVGPKPAGRSVCRMRSCM